MIEDEGERLVEGFLRGMGGGVGFANETLITKTNDLEEDFINPL